MRRLGAGGIVAALAVGAGTAPAFSADAAPRVLVARAAAPAVATDPPPSASAPRPWYKRMFVSAPKPAGPTVRSGPVTVAPPNQMPTSSPLSPDAVAVAFKAENDAYLRRLDVCVKLRQAAL